MRPSLRWIPLLLLLAWPAAARAQAAPLAHDTGDVAPGTGWTVLRRAQLEAQSRTSDPADETARRLLLAAIARLKADGRTGEHVLFHGSSDDGTRLRLVDAYSDETSTSVEQLTTAEAVAGVRDVLLQELSKEGEDVRFVQRRDARTTAGDVTMLALEFELTQQGRRRVLTHYAVPAGERVQYFDASFDLDDDGGREACARLVTSFDGARDAPPGLSPLVVGGVTGAVAGMLVAMLRRRRQYRRLAGEQAGGSDTGSAPGAG